MLDKAWAETVKISVHHRLHQVEAEIALYRGGNGLYLVGITDGQWDRHVGSVCQVAGGWATLGVFSWHIWPTKERAAVAVAAAYLQRVAVAIDAAGRLRAA